MLVHKWFLKSGRFPAVWNNLMDDISLQQFTAMDQAGNVASYIHALEAFDGIEQLQELKVIARQCGGIARGCSILDVGCGFGLETLRSGKFMVVVEKSGSMIASRPPGFATRFISPTACAGSLRYINNRSARTQSKLAFA